MKSMKTSTLLVVTFLATMLIFNYDANGSCTYEENITAEEFAMGNVLSWSTVTETNNEVFFVEKSADGVRFSTIGKVDGNGTTSDVQEYKFLDIAATSGKSFYRLKQVDFDGTSSFSPTTIIEKETGNNFTIISMKRMEEEKTIMVTILASSKDEINYTLFDENGKKINTQHHDIRRGINVLTLDMNLEPDENVLGFASKEDVGKPFRISLTGQQEIEHLNIASLYDRQANNAVKKKDEIKTKEK